MSLGLALALLAMTLLAMVLLLGPLVLRRRPPASRDAYNLAVYRDQLAEIERDIARGVLDPGDAEVARAEIGRRILALTPAEGLVAAVACAPGFRPRGDRGDSGAPRRAGALLGIWARRACPMSRTARSPPDRTSILPRR